VHGADRRNEGVAADSNSRLKESQIHATNYAGANTDGGLQAMQGLLTANPQVKNWLVYSCNEEAWSAPFARSNKRQGQDSCGVGLGDGALARSSSTRQRPLTAAACSRTPRSTVRPLRP
jgi:ABC-type sugar transport system substrate-binding protein